jgi:hypothetical protein
MLLQVGHLFCMEEDIRTIWCSSLQCDQPAAAHVRLRFGDPNSTMPFFIHKNFCENHVELASSRFTIVVRDPLGECPDNCE